MDLPRKQFAVLGHSRCSLERHRDLAFVYTAALARDQVGLDAGLGLELDDFTDPLVDFEGCGHAL